MNAVFFLYHYNDVDQITPVIWKHLDEGGHASAVMLDPSYAIEDDPRLAFLRETGRFHVTSVVDMLGVSGAAWLFRQHDGRTVGVARRAVRKLLRESGVSVGWAKAALRRLNPDVCVFEWGGEGGRNRTELLRAAKNLDVRTVCMPHGQSIYTNPSATTAIKESDAAGAQVRADYNVYDAYVLQSRFHCEREVSRGMDKTMCRIVGSARFCPEWYPVLDRIYPEFTPQEPTGNRLKVVFMVQQWNYNVDRGATLATLRDLAAADWIYLVVREHTRAAGRLPEAERQWLEDQTGCETTTTASSPGLIRWADAVVCFASSIAIEVVGRGTPLVNPRYCHDNTTIFDKFGAAHVADDRQGLLDILGDLAGSTPPRVAAAAHQAVLREAVYGGREPFDVLSAYCDVLRGSNDQRWTL